MTDAAAPGAVGTADPTSALFSDALTGIIASNPLTAAVVGAGSVAVQGASAVKGAVVSSAANWVLIGVGVVLALGALLISQQKPIANIVQAAGKGIGSLGEIA